MEMNDVKQLWKKELDGNIHLSTETKEEMVQNIINENVEQISKRNWGYPIVLTTFFAGLAFFFILFKENHVNFTNTSVQSENQLSNIFLHLDATFYWLIGLIILEWLALLLTITVILTTERWREKKGINFIRRLSKRSIILWFVGSSLLLGLGSFSFAGQSIEAIKFLIILFVFLNNCLFLLWSIRHKHLPNCPHCGHQISKKGRFKNSLGNYRTQCFHCGKQIFQSKKSRNKFPVFVPFLSFYSLGMLGIPFQLIGLPFTLVAIFHIFYISNFTISFTKEDDPLW